MLLKDALLKNRVSYELWRGWLVRKKINSNNLFTYKPGRFWLYVMFAFLYLVFSVFVTSAIHRNLGVLLSCPFFVSSVLAVRSWLIERSFCKDCVALVEETLVRQTIGSDFKEVDSRTAIMHSPSLAEKLVCSALTNVASQVLLLEETGRRKDANKCREKNFEPLHTLAMKFGLVCDDWGVYFDHARKARASADSLGKETRGGGLSLAMLQERGCIKPEIESGGG